MHHGVTTLIVVFGYRATPKNESSRKKYNPKFKIDSKFRPDIIPNSIPNSYKLNSAPTSTQLKQKTLAKFILPQKLIKMNPTYTNPNSSLAYINLTQNNNNSEPNVFCLNSTIKLHCACVVNIDLSNL